MSWSLKMETTRERSYYVSRILLRRREVFLDGRFLFQWNMCLTVRPDVTIVARGLGASLDRGPDTIQCVRKVSTWLSGTSLVIDSYELEMVFS